MRLLLLLSSMTTSLSLCWAAGSVSSVAVGGKMGSNCSAHLCLNGGICVDHGEYYECACTGQWTGDFCSIDVDECLNNGNNGNNNNGDRNSLSTLDQLTHDDRHRCLNGGTCVNTRGGFACVCVNGFTGSRCQHDIDDCLGASCFNGATCIDRVGSFQCKCPPGKTGLLCQLEDACSTMPCAAGARCETSPVDGSHRCTCRPGFRGSTCEEDINECQHAHAHDNNENNMAAPCEHNSTCINTPGSFSCRCRQGFVGARCEVNINECDGIPCLNDGTCLDEAGRFRCVCMPGFVGTRCETDVDECLAHSSGGGNGKGNTVCLNGGLCTDLVASFRCLCSIGFSGTRCETNDDDCRARPCNNGGACTDAIGGFRCTCTDGWSGARCEIMERNSNNNENDERVREEEEAETEKENMHAHPNPRNSNFNSRKQPISDETGNGIKSCDECHESSTCHRHAHGIVACTCPAWRTGARCEHHVTRQECDGACSNGGSCDWRIGACVCARGWTGSTCTEDVDECLAPETEMVCARGMVCENTRGGYTCRIPEMEFRENSPETEINECNSFYDSYCARNFANNYCDHGCDTRQCAWDGGDCLARADNNENGMENGGKLVRVHGRLVVFVGIPLSRAELEKLRRLLSQRAGLLLEQTAQNDTHVTWLAWREREETRADIDMTAIAAQLSSSPSLARDTGLALRFSAADEWREEKTDARDNENDNNESRASDSALVTCLALVVILFLGGVVAVLLANQRTRVKGVVTWFPDGFFTNSTNSSANSNHARDNSSARAAGGEFRKSGARQNSSRRRNGDGEDNYGNGNGNEKHVMMSTWSSVACDSPLTPPAAPPTPSLAHVGPNAMTPLHAAVIGATNHALAAQRRTDGGGENIAPSADDLLASLLLQSDARALVTHVTESTCETALHLAARHARADAAKRLLDAGADSNARDTQGRSPLHAAIAADARGVFELLLRHRATDLNLRAHDGSTPLMLAARLAVDHLLDSLLLAEARVNDSDNEGRTAVHWAALVNNCHALRMLVLHGANRDACTCREETPLLLAAREGCLAAARILLENGANRDACDQLDQTARDVALSRRHDDIVRLLDETSTTVSVAMTTNSNNGLSHVSTTMRRETNNSKQKQKLPSLPVAPSAAPPPPLSAPLYEQIYEQIPQMHQMHSTLMLSPPTPLSSSSSLSPPSSSCAAAIFPPPAYDECFRINSNICSANNNVNKQLVMTIMTPSPESQHSSTSSSGWLSPPTHAPLDIYSAAVVGANIAPPPTQKRLAPTTQQTAVFI